MTANRRREIAAFLVCTFASVWAAPSLAGNAVPLEHGKDITAANTGPAAAGYRGLKAFAGGEIRDGKPYAFAREISASAHYDDFLVTGPHLLIEGAAFSSTLDIYTAKPVVLRGVSVRPDAARPAAILTRPSAGPVYVLWSDIGGTDARNRGLAVGAGLALRASNAVVYRSRVSQTGDGIDISGSNIRIEETLIDALTAFDGDHNDAVQLMGAPQNITIARNKILNSNPQTSCLYLLGGTIDVASNYLAGGGWTIYGGAKNNGHGGIAASNVRVTGTIFGRDYFAKSGGFGPVSYWDKTNTRSNNRFSDGAAIVP